MRRATGRWIVLSALLLLFSSTAHSQWVFSAYFGKSHTQSSDLAIKQPSRGTDLVFYDVSYSDRSFEFPVYYGFRVAYFLPVPLHVGIEGEFVHAKIYSDPTQTTLVVGYHDGTEVSRSMRLGEIVQQFSISHGLNFIFVNIVAGITILSGRELGTGPVDFLARLGVGPTFPHMEATIDSIGGEQYDFDGPALQLAAGFQARIFWRLNVLLEYKYTSNKLTNAGIVGGTVSSTLRTHHLVFGFAVSL